MLAQVVDELAAILPGARVDKVVHGAEDSLLLVLHQAKKNHYLLLSPERSLPRIHLVSRKTAGTAVPAGFFLYLKKHLIGSRIEEIRLVDSDRIVEIRFVRPDGVYLLFFELTGSVTNLILTDGTRKILSVRHPVPPGDRVVRPLLAGLTYHPLEERRRVEKVKGRDALAGPLGGYDGNTPVNAAVEAWYERTLKENEAASLRRQLVAAIRKAAAKVERRRGAVSADVAGAEKGDGYRVAGELILANKDRLKKGQAQADLTGYDGERMPIVLDPTRSPAENARRYFQRYKKAKAGLALMRERLAEARDEAAFLKALQEDLDVAKDCEGMLAVRTELVRRGYVRDGAGKAVAASRAAAPPFRTVDHEGWQILIGKSSAGNDYVTMKLARPDDLWLHAEGMPGSHVVVRNPGKRDIPEGVLKRAASLAAYYSKGKGSAKVPVAYTKAAMVKKPKGAAPGTVILTGRKTTMAAPESD
jgi:predicted ribosome quality control (RQC) complex YloA/Tae2 family protein